MVNPCYKRHNPVVRQEQGAWMVVVVVVVAVEAVEGEVNMPPEILVPGEGNGVHGAVFLQFPAGNVQFRGPDRFYRKNRNPMAAAAQGYEPDRTSPSDYLRETAAYR